MLACLPVFNCSPRVAVPTLCDGAHGAQRRRRARVHRAEDQRELLQLLGVAPAESAPAAHAPRPCRPRRRPPQRFALPRCTSTHAHIPLHHCTHDTHRHRACAERNVCRAKGPERVGVLRLAHAPPLFVLATPRQTSYISLSTRDKPTVECLGEDDKRTLLEAEIRQCDELLEMEPDCVCLSSHTHTHTALWCGD